MMYVAVVSIENIMSDNNEWTLAHLSTNTKPPESENRRNEVTDSLPVVGGKNPSEAIFLSSEMIH